MSFINPKGSALVKPASAPLPPTDDPELPPRTVPVMSAQREQAIAKAISDGKARTIPHALFLHRAGVLELPI